jgi:hypothetical protein
MKSIRLSPLTYDVVAEIGDEFYYEFKEHLIAGFSAEFEIEDESVIQHKNTETVYEHSGENKASDKNQPDMVSTTFSFKAVSKGTSILLIKNLFNFILESEYRFRIKVK